METFPSSNPAASRAHFLQELMVACVLALMSLSPSNLAFAEGVNATLLAEVMNGPCGEKNLGGFTKLKTLDDGLILMTRPKNREDPGPALAPDNRVLIRALALSPAEIQRLQLRAHASELLDSEVVELARLCGLPDGPLATAKKKLVFYQMAGVLGHAMTIDPGLARFSGVFPTKPPVLSRQEQEALDSLNASPTAQVALKKIKAKVPFNIQQAFAVLNVQTGYDISYAEEMRLRSTVN
jgi:hypothetical protein